MTEKIRLQDRDYTGPWRNRGYTFYIQMCYQDELTGQWAKLRALLDKHGVAFDDYWLYYYPKKKVPEKRPTAARRPLWQELDERFGVTSKSLGYTADQKELERRRVRDEIIMAQIEAELSRKGAKPR